MLFIFFNGVNGTFVPFKIFKNPFPVDSVKKYKIKSNPKKFILMYYKIQSDQPRITRNAFAKVRFSVYLLNHRPDDDLVKKLKI